MKDFQGTSKSTTQRVCLGSSANFAVFAYRDVIMKTKVGIYLTNYYCHLHQMEGWPFQFSILVATILTIQH